VAADEAVYLLAPRTRSWTPIDADRGDVGGSRASPREVRFSPGGGTLAAAWSDAEIRVYSLTTRERVKTMRFGREGLGPRLLAFSPGGLMLAATDGQRVIQVWPMSEFGAPVALTAPRGPVQSMWFAPDGRSLVISAYGDRYLRTLPLPATR
jgi:WD40 repeat protein